jgi:Mce-associated membrane protein
MAEAKKPPQDSAKSKADTLALIAEAEAEAAEAEALAAAARARARAARLRREVQAQDEAEAEAETVETTEEAPDAGEDATDTTEAKTDDTDADAAEDATDTAEAKTNDDVTETVEATDADEAEADEEVSGESPEDPESESKSARSRRLRLPSLSVTWKAVVIVLICAFVGASGYMVWQRNETTERNQRTANFIAGARQGVVNMFSLDFNRSKEDVQRVIDSSTGQFRDDLQQRAKDFTTVVEQSKVVTQGTVNAAAVQSIDGNSALVLVAASSQITNAAGAKDERRNWRLKVTVTDDGGQYKMSKLEFVP